MKRPAIWVKTNTMGFRRYVKMKMGLATIRETLSDFWPLMIWE